MNKFYRGKSEKLSWSSARKDVSSVNANFAKIIDALSPSDDHWMLKVTYPYGSMVMNQSVLNIPNHSGKVVPITSDEIDKEIREGINYNLNSNPVSIVIKNSFEIYLPLENRTLPLSGLIEPGTIFGASRMLSPNNTEQPVFIWDMTAGARSVFMLPKITEDLKHKKLQKAFGIHFPTPRNLMQHWNVFRELSNNSENLWSAEILYFSKKWFEHLDDKRWAEFYQYFQQSGWAGTEHWRNQPMWNLIFSLILKEYEARPNAYIMDTAQYLINMGVGAFTGIGPAENDISGPWSYIQKIYQDVYEIRNYPPIILHPQIFDLKNQSASPVYYSLQFPIATQFKPSSRVKVSIISDLHEIRALLTRYERDLLSDKYNLGGTSLAELFQKVNYGYLHNTSSLHEGMMHTCDIKNDTRFLKTLDGKTHQNFPSSCLFGQGCIRVSHKNNT